MFVEFYVIGLALSFVILLPLGKKWEIENRVTVPAAAVIGLCCGAIAERLNTLWHLNYLHIVSIQIAVIGFIAGSLILWRFHRDPERKIPEGNDIIVSPADGKIIYVKKFRNGEIPFAEKNSRTFPLVDFVQSNLLPGEGILIGIAMNFLDVHVNRSPIDGRVSLLNHIKGLYISLKKKEAVIQNERVLTIIDNKCIKIAIVQIASRLVRKITPYIKEGQEVRKGQRIGMIRFGSQVDLCLPDLPSLRLNVSLGEKVKAGVSVVATLEPGGN